MNNTPLYLQDAALRLTATGFVHDDVWYHGTSSVLWPSIQQHGLQRSGDKALNQSVKQTMATIGNSYAESIEPVFLSPSKELAYFWAEQRVRERAARFGSEETPVVLEIKLPEGLQKKVKPDVGAMSLLLLEQGENYMILLARLCEEQGLPAPDIDIKNADRMAYLECLGMAYLDSDIDSEYVTLLEV